MDGLGLSAIFGSTESAVDYIKNHISDIYFISNSTGSTSSSGVSTSESLNKTYSVFIVYYSASNDSTSISGMHIIASDSTIYGCGDAYITIDKTNKITMRVYNGESMSATIIGIE